MCERALARGEDPALGQAGEQRIAIGNLTFDTAGGTAGLNGAQIGIIDVYSV